MSDQKAKKRRKSAGASSAAADAMCYLIRLDPEIGAAVRAAFSSWLKAAAPNERTARELAFELRIADLPPKAEALKVIERGRGYLLTRLLGELTREHRTSLNAPLAKLAKKGGAHVQRVRAAA